MSPLSDVGEPAVGLDLHGAHLVRSRCIRHFMPTTGVPAPQEPHETADRRHSGGDHRRPHQYLSQPHAPLNSDHPLLGVPKSGQLVHAHGDAHDRWGETRYTRSNTGDDLFDHAPAKPTQPSRCATPINPRPRRPWRSVPARCGRIQGAPLSRRCHMSGDTTGDGRGPLWMIVAVHVPLLRQQVTHRDGAARTVNPSAYAYTGSNPVPATLVRPLRGGLIAL